MLRILCIVCPVPCYSSVLITSLSIAQTICAVLCVHLHLHVYMHIYIHIYTYTGRSNFMVYVCLFGILYSVRIASLSMVASLQKGVDFIVGVCQIVIEILFEQYIGIEMFRFTK